MAFRVSRKLFVSNLPWTVGQRELFEYFSSFGPVVSHTVIFDKSTGLSRKYGFVQFGNEDGYRTAIKQKTHYLEGNYVCYDRIYRLSSRACFQIKVEETNRDV